jgi:hypothetical protein
MDDFFLVAGEPQHFHLRADVRVSVRHGDACGHTAALERGAVADGQIPQDDAEPDRMQDSELGENASGRKKGERNRSMPAPKLAAIAALGRR